MPVASVVLPVVTPPAAMRSLYTPAVPVARQEIPTPRTVIEIAEEAAEESKVGTVETTGKKKKVKKDGKDDDYAFDEEAFRSYNLVIDEADLAVLDNNPTAEEYVRPPIIIRPPRSSPAA